MIMKANISVVHALIYLWSRDAGMEVNEETEAYLKQHLTKLQENWRFEFSDQERLNMTTRLAGWSPY